MKSAPATATTGHRRQHMLAAMADHHSSIQRRALASDASATFPTDDVALLRDMGILTAPLPTALGGLGLGTEQDGALPLLDMLSALGRANLSLGCVMEAHVHAIRLITRYGSEIQVRQTVRDVLAGHLFALWVVDAADAPVRLHRSSLRGAKFGCGGAGHATRALITAEIPNGETVMLVLAMDAGGPQGIDTSFSWMATGMRAQGSARVAMAGLRPSAPIGEPGDFLREPDFSAGGWRTSAVILGGVEALVAEMRRLIAQRGRTENLHQRARVGEALIAQETARLWVRRAALLAEDREVDGDDAANTVNLARIACEDAALRAISVVQRALGVSALRQGSVAELLFRDLSTYLRQPGSDEALTEAAAHFMQRDLPPLV